MTGGMRETGKGGMQERTDERKEGSGQERCWTVDRKGYRKGGMQDRCDAGLEGCKKGGSQSRGTYIYRISYITIKHKNKTFK